MRAPARTPARSGSCSCCPTRPAGSQRERAETGSWSATSTCRRSTSATAPGTCATSSTGYGDERTALAAYHAGQGNVDRWRSDGVGIQFPETRSYVENVEHAKKIYAKSYAKELGLR